MNINISDLILFYQVVADGCDCFFKTIFLKKSKKVEGLCKEFNQPTPFEQIK
jgi:hypothetical protein